MPKILYERKKFKPKTLAMVDRVNDILEEYAELGYDLTLRQVFYQFVSRGWIANKQTEYHRLGGVIRDARRAGLIDWSRIVDRTRNMRELNHWKTPEAMIEEMTKRYFNTPKWDDQPFYIEVWVEKDALVGVVQRAANQLDIPYFSCRGYISEPEKWSAAQRLLGKLKQGKQVRILHLGDHDP